MSSHNEFNSPTRWQRKITFIKPRDTIAREQGNALLFLSSLHRRVTVILSLQTRGSGVGQGN
jgi:hypothetical protein